MIKCMSCGRMAQMTYHEEIATCPYCNSDGWHIYHIQKGYLPTYNARAMKAIRESPVPPRGRCILTPKGKMVNIGLLRASDDDEKAGDDD